MTLRSLPGSNGRRLGPNTHIFSKTASASWTNGGKEFFIDGGSNRLGFGAYAVNELFSTGVITNDGLWHHVTVTFVDSTNTLTFYIDGVASGSGTLNLPADVASHVIKVGGHPAGTLLPWPDGRVPGL